MADPTLLRAFRFGVRLFRSDGSGTLGDGGFAECSGLDVEMDVHEHFEGGRNDAVVRQVGRARYAPLILKRGMFLGIDEQVNRDLWAWLQSVVAGERPVVRYDGIVEVLQPDGSPAARWAFERGLPSKISGPQLHGRTGEVAVEELTIVHEGLRLVGG